MGYTVTGLLCPCCIWNECLFTHMADLHAFYEARRILGMPFDISTHFYSLLFLISGCHANLIWQSFTTCSVLRHHIFRMYLSLHTSLHQCVYMYMYIYNVYTCASINLQCSPTSYMYMYLPLYLSLNTSLHQCVYVHVYIYISIYYTCTHVYQCAILYTHFLCTSTFYTCQAFCGYHLQWPVHNALHISNCSVLLQQDSTTWLEWVDSGRQCSKTTTWLEWVNSGRQCSKTTTWLEWVDSGRQCSKTTTWLEWVDSGRQTCESEVCVLLCRLTSCTPQSTITSSNLTGSTPNPTAERETPDPLTIATCSTHPHPSPLSEDISCRSCDNLSSQTYSQHCCPKVDVDFFCILL